MDAYSALWEDKPSSFGDSLNRQVAKLEGPQI